MTIYQWLDTPNARTAWDKHMATHQRDHRLDAILLFVARAHRCTFDDIETYIGVGGIQYRVSDTNPWYGLPGYLLAYLGHTTWLVSQRGYSAPFLRDYWFKPPAQRAAFLDQWKLVEWHEEQAALPG
jgi:hypothetical protein